MLHPLQQPALPALEQPLERKATVVMAVWVTEEGEVAEVVLDISSGVAELDQAAMKGTESWRLLPGTMGGTPICMWGKFAVTFDPYLDARQRTQGPALIGVARP